jgi:hypothetical protein
VRGYNAWTDRGPGQDRTGQDRMGRDRMGWGRWKMEDGRWTEASGGYVPIVIPCKRASERLSG